MGGGEFGDSGIAPDSFGGPGPGGGNGELTEQQMIAMCAVHDKLSLLADLDLVDFMAENYAHIYDVSEEMIADILKNGTGCAPINASMAEKKQLEADAALKAEADKIAAADAAAKAEREALIHKVDMTVAEDGYPLSNDPIWNACIRNLQQELLGKPLCYRFHHGHMWENPDTHIAFKWSDRYVKSIEIPGKLVVLHVVPTPDYIVKRDMKLAKLSVSLNFASKLKIYALRSILALGYLHHKI